MRKESEQSGVQSTNVPSFSIVPEETSNETVSLASLRFGSFHGSVAETTRRRSERMSQISLGSRGGEGSGGMDDHVDSDTESHGGRKFLSLQQHPDKMPSKQRRMNSIIDLGVKLDDGADKPGFHAFGALSDEGYNASYNQDAMLHINGVGNVPHTAIFGVFDGHGNHGDEVANFAKDLLYKSFLAKYNQNGNPLSTEEVTEIIISSFLTTQSEMEEDGDQFYLAGTTASIVFFQNQMAFFANVGDSRIVLGRECVCCKKLGADSNDTGSDNQRAHVIALPVSVDHRVGEIAEEKERVLKAGGLVKLDPKLPSNAFDEMRIYAPEQRYPGLVTSRTLGDTLGHSLGVISNPEVSFKRIDDHDQVIIIGSDGVWDILSDQEAVDLVLRHKDPESATNALVDECVRGWSDEFDVGDNVSAIVLFLKDNSSVSTSNAAEATPKADQITSVSTTTKTVKRCNRKWTWMEVRQQVDLRQCKAELSKKQEEEEKEKEKEKAAKVAANANANTKTSPAAPVVESVASIPTANTAASEAIQPSSSSSSSAPIPSSPSKPKPNPPVAQAETSHQPSSPVKSSGAASGSSAQKTGSDNGRQSKALVPQKRSNMCSIL